MSTPTIAVYGSARITPDDPRYVAGIALGAALATAGFRVVTGGYEGLMSAVSHGAREAGGEVLGYTVTAWDGLPANRWVTTAIDNSDLFDRLRRFSQVDLGIALDGGIGTLVEVAAAWNLLQVTTTARPLLLVGDAWVAFLAYAREHLVVGPADLRLVSTLPSGAAPAEIVAAVRSLLNAAPASARIGG